MQTPRCGKNFPQRISARRFLCVCVHLERACAFSVAGFRLSQNTPLSPNVKWQRVLVKHVFLAHLLRKGKTWYLTKTTNDITESSAFFFAFKHMKDFYLCGALRDCEYRKRMQHGQQRRWRSGTNNCVKKFEICKKRWSTCRSSNARTHTHIHTYTDSHALTHTHTYMNLWMHMNTLTHTNIHIYTHIQLHNCILTLIHNM